MLEVIDEECDRLNRFIEGLVEMARIEAGEFQLRRRWGTIEEMVEMAIARAKPIATEHQFRVEIESDLPVVLVDARAVSEVFYTLIDNAAKYSPDHTLIHIAAARAANDTIRASVQDSGPGIPVELRERVFDKFFRASRDGVSIGSQPTGTGMGLAIARGIVEAHNGRIWIESGAGGLGTLVVFTLPIGDENHPEIEGEALQEPSYAKAKD
jgi:two-component system sensor histidine kinase KdpD